MIANHFFSSEMRSCRLKDNTEALNIRCQSSIPESYGGRGSESGEVGLTVVWRQHVAFRPRGPRLATAATTPKADATWTLNRWKKKFWKQFPPRPPAALASSEYQLFILSDPFFTNTISPLFFSFFLSSYPPILASLFPALIFTALLTLLLLALLFSPNGQSLLTLFSCSPII